MDSCCNHPLPSAQDRPPPSSARRVIAAALVINAGMFLVEMFSGFAVGSQALQADALDFAADAAAYGLTLGVLGMHLHIRARAAQAKAFGMVALAILVLAGTGLRAISPGVPEAAWMGGIGLLALAANAACVALLYGLRAGDANLRSLWLCSRNDMIGNLAVIGSGAAVAITHSPYPDLAVAALMAGLFLRGALEIAKRARHELAGVPGAVRLTEG